MTTGLLEREDVMSRAEVALERAQSGRGSLLVIEGRAGMGKTAVLAAVRETAAARGLRVLRGRGAQLEREFGFGVVRQLVEPAMMAMSAEERSALLQGPAELAGRVLGLPGANGIAPPDGDPSFAVLHGLYWLLAGMAAERPALLVVDDGQWADAASLRYLAFLATRLDDLPVALIVATRPAPTGPDVASALGADDVIQLSPLSPGGVGRLVSEAGMPDDGGFAVSCHHATRGTPFLVRQLITALREERVSAADAAASRLGRIGSRSVGRWALARLGGPGTPSDRLARAVAVLEEGDLQTAAGLAELDLDAAAEAADALAAAGILEAERPLRYAHPIVRSGIYAELSGAERASAHLRAAELLAERDASDGRVAEHLLAVEPRGEPWVATRLVEAARVATKTGAPESAVVYLRRALAEPPVAGERASVLLALGIAEDAIGDPCALEDLEFAFQVAAPGEPQVRAAIVLANARRRANRSAAAVAAIDRAACGGDERLEQMLEIAAVGVGMISVDTAPALRRRLRRVRESADNVLVPQPRELLGVSALAAAEYSEPAPVAAALARRALADGALPAPGELPWFSQATMTLVWCEFWDEAEPVLDAAIGEARATGDGVLWAVGHTHRGLLNLRRGDLVAAEADARSALETPNLPAPVLYRNVAIGVLVNALVEMRRLEDAEAFLEPYDEEIEAGMRTAAFARTARGRLRTAQRRLEPAIADFLAAGDVLTRCAVTCPGFVPWRSQAAIALGLAGEHDRARELAGAEVGYAREFAAPRALGVALHAAGVVAAGEGEDPRTTGDAARSGTAPGEVLLRDAVAVLADAGAPVALARAQADLGALLRRDNRRAEARDLLREALDVAHHAGAREIAERAEAELRATGARPRRTMLTGLEALTASERRVAELAVEGLTNPQIAQALFITRRTVEGHLTQVFSKLGVDSRQALPDALKQPVSG
jgi:DNA-binding CsgD family transcriptional regulator